MIPLVGVGVIIKKHFETLKEDANWLWQIGLFLVVPILVTVILLLLNKGLTNNSANALITAFSIFTGLLLNVILIIFAIVDRSIKPESEGSKKARLLHHLYANSIYALLISVLILIVLIITVILDDWQNCFLIFISSAIVYIGVTHFVMTLLMIFKRLYVLLFDCK
jgi:hypothetical protein